MAYIGVVMPNQRWVTQDGAKELGLSAAKLREQVQRKALRFAIATNPFASEFASMKLYLRRDVEAILLSSTLQK